MSDHVKRIVRVESDFVRMEGAVGIDAARALTSAGITRLGGGFMRLADGGELRDWTLPYDEVMFVLEGELLLSEGGKEHHIPKGEGVLLRHGATVSYRSTVSTEVLYVLYPVNWHEEPLVNP